MGSKGNGKGKWMLTIDSSGGENRTGGGQDVSLRWSMNQGVLPPGMIPIGLFASVGQMGMGVGIPSNPRGDDRQSQIRRLVAAELSSSETELPFSVNGNYLSSAGEFGFKTLIPQADVLGKRETAVVEEEEQRLRKGTRRRFRLRVGNAAVKRLLSGGIAGAISRTAVAPLETIRTHLMVGSSGRSMTEVFQHIMQAEGWQGLFRGNGVNVIRVAPSKAIELFAYDTVKNILTPKPEDQPRVSFPVSPIAGAAAGVCSTLCTYPLELLKTRLTIQRGVYDNLLHAFMKIVQEEGPQELYRGLTPSLIGVVPYAATNYFAYETLRRLYKKLTKKQQIGNLATLFIGSGAGAIASSATFPLEVARKHMQVGALSGRQVYKNLFHALSSILEQEGVAGLYRGLGPSCMKLVPAAGISFMCYEACKRILIEEGD